MSFSSNKSRQHRPMADINVTPMVDVMLVLLVIFIMAAPLLTHSVKVDLPAEQAEKSSAEQKPVVLSIDASGQFFIDKSPVAEAELSAHLNTLATKNPQTQIRINADQSIAYAKVAHILAAAQTAGLNRISFITSATSK